MLSIKDQPKSLRPRERLAEQGVEALSTAELLTILLGSGSQKIPVQQLAKKMEKKLRSGQKLSVKYLQEVKGIGLAKACQIVAALELVERIFPRAPEDTLNSLDKVLGHLADLQWSSKEQVVGLYLDARLKLIHREVLAVGSVNQSIIAPRDVFSPIKFLPVVSLILAHNHPSGNPFPSHEDTIFTQSMKQAGELLGVELLDHVIVAKRGHFSYKQSGQL